MPSPHLPPGEETNVRRRGMERSCKALARQELGTAAAGARAARHRGSWAVTLSGQTRQDLPACSDQAKPEVMLKMLGNRLW